VILGFRPRPFGRFLELHAREHEFPGSSRASLLPSSSLALAGDMAKERFSLLARVSTDNPVAVAPILDALIAEGFRYGGGGR